MGVKLDRFKKAFGGDVSDSLVANRQEKVREALRGLKTAVDALQAIGAATEPHKSALFGLVVRFSNINKMPTGNADVYESLDTLKDDARAAATLAKAAALAAPEAEAGENRILTQCNCGTGRKSDLRAAAVTALDDDPRFLHKLAALPGGTAVLDALVADLGGNARSEAEQKFVREAIQARYNITQLDGDLQRKSLPHLYRVLGMVPESHARDNPMLAKIVLKIGDGSGDYTGGKLNLNCMRPNDAWFGTEFDPDEDDGMDPAWRAAGDEHSVFDATTLHEMGHAIDDQMKFMDKRSGNDDFGGWVKLTKAQLARTAGTRLGFFEKWSGKYAPHMLQWFVESALSGPVSVGYWESQKAQADEAPTREALLGDAGVVAAEQTRVRLSAAEEWDTGEAANAFNTCRPKLKGQQRFVGAAAISLILDGQMPAEEAVDKLLSELAAVGDPPVEKDWDQMLKDPTSVWCELARTSNSWKLGSAHAKAVAKMDGNVYTRDKQGWFKYTLAARAKCISKYQFNTPAEWFSELYAAYYLKKLPAAHPDHKWLTDDVHKYIG